MNEREVSPSSPRDERQRWATLGIVFWNSLHALINAGEWLGNSIEWFFFFENESERKFGRKRDEKNKDKIIMHDSSSVCLHVNFVCRHSHVYGGINLRCFCSRPFCLF